MKIVPIFIAFCNSDNFGHISIGVDSETLCGIERISSVIQVEKTREPLDKINDQGKLTCDKCSEVWGSVKNDINPEPTVECSRCDMTYSAVKARTVEKSDEGSVPVCKPCYIKLYENSKTDVDVKYENSEAFLSGSSDRTYEISDTD